MDGHGVGYKISETWTLTACPQNYNQYESMAIFFNTVVILSIIRRAKSMLKIMGLHEYNMSHLPRVNLNVCFVLHYNTRSTLSAT